jgi:hypothetical protein
MLKATFSQAKNAATINTGTIELRDPANALVAAYVIYDGAAKTATLTPSNPLPDGTYTAAVRGAALSRSRLLIRPTTGWMSSSVRVWPPDTRPREVTSRAPGKALALLREVLEQSASSLASCRTPQLTQFRRTPGLPLCERKKADVPPRKSVAPDEFPSRGLILQREFKTAPGLRVVPSPSGRGLG